MRINIGSKKLHPHQIAAVEWIMSKTAGGLLCDEMGLGKTLTTAGFLLNKPVAHTLILGPLAVLDQWLIVLKNLNFAIYVIKNSAWSRIQGNPIFGCIYLTNYDKLTSDLPFFKKPWDRIICDEAHILRNHECKKYVDLKKLNYKCIWFLTGTPVVNRIEDLGALIHLIDRSISPKSATLNKGLDWMCKYALQRSVSQIRDLLPGVLPVDPVVYNHILDFATEAEGTFYRGIQGHISEALESLMSQDRMDMSIFLGLIMRLRQISTHPQVYINARKKQMGKDYLRADWQESSTKTDKIIDILQREKTPHGYVIFCHFNDEMEIIKKRLEKEMFVGNILMYNGSMTSEMRSKIIEESEASVINDTYCHTVLLIQIQSGGTGLNLQHMDRVIFTSSWWTAALMDQAVGRVVRLGQNKVVHVHHLSFKEEESLNIDTYINERVEIKRNICMQLLAAANHDAV
jgi:SNF2 family DNA or RNA helicase